MHSKWNEDITINIMIIKIIIAITIRTMIIIRIIIKTNNNNENDYNNNQCITSLFPNISTQTVVEILNGTKVMLPKLTLKIENKTLNRHIQ